MRINKKAAAVAVAAVTVAGAGTAYAYWSTTGTGGGNATAGTSVANSISVTGEDPTGIVLGAAATDIKAIAQNTATYSQSAGAVTAVPSYPAGCDNSGTLPNWTYTPAATAPTVGVLTANDGTAGSGTDQKEVTVGTLQLIDQPTVNQNSCKNAVVTFVFSAA